MSDSKPPHRTSSYERLKAKLVRDPSQLNNKKDWNRPDTPEAIIRHALRGGARKSTHRFDCSIPANTMHFKTLLVSQVHFFWHMVCEQASISACI
jgi:hypothetical protein